MGAEFGPLGGEWRRQSGEGGGEKAEAAGEELQKQGGGGEPENDSHCRRAQPPQAHERVPRRAPVDHAAGLCTKGTLINIS